MPCPQSIKKQNKTKSLNFDESWTALRFRKGALPFLSAIHVAPRFALLLAAWVGRAARRLVADGSAAALVRPACHRAQTSAQDLPDGVSFYNEVMTMSFFKKYACVATVIHRNRNSHRTTRFKIGVLGTSRRARRARRGGRGWRTHFGRTAWGTRGTVAPSSCLCAGRPCGNASPTSYRIGCRDHGTS